MDPLDILIGAIGLDSPTLSIAIGLTAEDFDALPGIISDAPVFEAIASLTAVDLDIVEPFEAIVVTPEIAAAELVILHELVIPVEVRDRRSRGAALGAAGTRTPSRARRRRRRRGGARPHPCARGIRTKEQTKCECHLFMKMMKRTLKF